MTNESLEDYRVKLLSDEEIGQWDQYITDTTEANLCQSTYWKRVTQRVDHAKPLFLVVKKNHKTIANLLLFEKYPFKRTRYRYFFRLPVLQCLDGPVIHSMEKEESLFSMEALLEWIENYARHVKAFDIHFQGFSHTSTFAHSTEMLNLFQKYAYKDSKWATLLVDLTPSKDSIWRSISHAARKCVNKCRREGVYIRRIENYEDLKNNFYIPYAAARKERGLSCKPFDIWRIAFEEDTKNYYHYFVAESIDHKSLAFLGMYTFNGIATEIASIITPHAYEQKIPAQDLIHWDMMLYAKNLGCHTFDLAGVNPKPQSAGEIGIRRFKEKWSGKYVEYYRYRKEMYPLYMKLIKSVKDHISPYSKTIKKKIGR